MRGTHGRQSTELRARQSSQARGEVSLGLDGKRTTRAPVVAHVMAVDLELHAGQQVKVRFAFEY